MLTARGLGMSASPSIVLQNSATARVGSLWGMSEHGALLALPPLRGIGGRYTIFDASLSSAGWNYFIEMECVEELPLTRCQPTHHSLPPDIDRVSSTESRFAAPINGVLQHNPLKSGHAQSGRQCLQR